MFRKFSNCSARVCTLAIQPRQISRKNISIGLQSPVVSIVDGLYEFHSNLLQIPKVINQLLPKLSLETENGIEDADSHILNLSSTMKKRSDKMNKHKLKKRRKSLRMNTKANRK